MKTAEAIYQELRISNILPPLDAKNKRLFCELITAQQLRPTLPSLPTDEEIDEMFPNTFETEANVRLDDIYNPYRREGAKKLRDRLNQSPVVGEGEKTAIEKKVDDFLEKMYPFANHNREYLKTHILKFCEAKNIY